MQRGDTRRIPVSSNLPLGIAAPKVRAIRELDTPALQHRGTIPASGLPRAYDPFRFTQDRRQLTTEVVDDCNDPGGSGSLAYRAAKAQYARRSYAAQESCQATTRSVIVDFDSNQSNCAFFVDCASDNRTLADRDAFVGQMSLRLPDPMTSIRAHRLLYASIPSYELLNRFREGQNVMLNGPIVANAAPAGCGEEQYALTITEQFTIDSRNQVVQLFPEASIMMPQTLTAVSSLLHLRKETVDDICGPQKEECPHYVVQTKCDNQFLPGLLFYLLLGGGQTIVKHSYDDDGDDDDDTKDNRPNVIYQGGKSMCDSDCESLSSSSCSSSSEFRSHSKSKPCKKNKKPNCRDPLRPGAPTPCLEVLEILDSSRFLARIVGTVFDTPPSFQAFLKRRVIRAQTSSTVFTAGGNGLQPSSSYNVIPQEYLWCDPEDRVYCAQYYSTLYCFNSKPLCRHEPCDQNNNCVRKEAQCGGAVAYVPPATSPCELADFVSCVVQQVRDFMLAENDQTGGAVPLHPLVDVSGVSYEPQTDTYIVNRYSGGFVRWRTLLDTRSYGDTAALNFPFRRRQMVATDAADDAKQRYINAVFDGFHWFVVCKGVNDCFCIQLCDKQKLRICVPAGCYRPHGLANALQKAMNQAVPVDDPYEFTVSFSLHPVNGLNQFIEEEVVRPKANKRPDIGFPPCRNEPYQVQAFAFTIENTKKKPFSLLLENAQAFAALLDFEPRRYGESARFVSRVLAPLECLAPRNPQQATSRCTIASDCAPCPRRRYHAFVDSQCGFTTISQVQPHPVECTVVEQEDDCDCDVGDCVWLQCVVEQGGDDYDSGEYEYDSSNSSSESGTVVGEQNEKQENVCKTSKKATCLPFCVGDVVWFQAKGSDCAHGHQAPYEHENESHAGKKEKTPLIGAVVLCVRQDPCFPNFHYIAVHLEVDAMASSNILVSPVGFNLHLHPALPALDSIQSSLSPNRRLVSQKGAIARWLGFTHPFTRSGCRSYTSNGAPQSILDERIILRIPELATLGLSEQRENHYQQLSPFDTVLTENYNVLALDRARGAYRFDAASAGPSLGLSIGLVPPTNVLAPQGSSQQTCIPGITFQLYRPNGEPYDTGGYALVASLEIVYC